MMCFIYFSKLTCLFKFKNSYLEENLHQSHKWKASKEWSHVHPMKVKQLLNFSQILLLNHGLLCSQKE